MNITAGLQGHYTVTVYRPDNTIRESIDFPNLITDFGLNLLGTTGINSCFIGTGNAAPAVTDTKLESYLGGTNFITAQSALKDTTNTTYWVQQSNTYRFGAGAASGNISEVGVGTGQGAAGHRLFSRALIVDGSGNPLTISIQPDEILEITYSLRLYPPLVDVPFTLDISGTTHSGILRARAVQSDWSVSMGSPMVAPGAQAKNDGDLGPITGGSTGRAGSGSTGIRTPDAYVPGTYSLTVTAKWGLDASNHHAGINILDLSPGGVSTLNYFFQAKITPPIMKTNEKVLSLRFSITWARYVA